MRKDGLSVPEIGTIRTWADVETARLQLNRAADNDRFLSRAALCRRAGISDSTITKGLKGGRSVSAMRNRWVTAVLEAERMKLVAEIENWPAIDARAATDAYYARRNNGR